MNSVTAMKRRHAISALSSLPNWLVAASAWPATATASAAAVPDDAAHALAERMLEALGGRARWAAVRTLRNDSQQNRITEPRVVRAVIHLQLAPLAVRIDTTAPGLRLARAVLGHQHWRIGRDGRTLPIPDEVLADDRQWLATHIYRTIARVAARDPALTLQQPQPQRLEVWQDGALLIWLLLDAAGEPYRFGRGGDDAGTLCGPWAFESGGIRHPVWTSNRDGTWRAWLRELVVNADMPATLWQPGLPPGLQPGLAPT